MNNPAKPPPLSGTVQRYDPDTGRQEGAEDTRPPWLRILHPWSAGLLLAVDNLCFGANAVTGFLATPIVIAVAFTVTFAGVYRMQRQRGGDGVFTSLTKALLCGALAAVPWSVAGTAVGGLVLLAAGMSGSSPKNPPQS